MIDTQDPTAAVGRYRGHDWADMSHYVAHFIGDDRVALSDALRFAKLDPGDEDLGFARKEGWSMRAVCLSEIPPDQLARLAERHGRYGVAFHVDALVTGAKRVRTPFARVWYLEKDSEVATRAWSAAFSAKGLDEHEQLRVALSTLLPFIDVAGVYNGVRREFEWEREWRWSGTLRFAQGDLRMVFAPEGDHDALRAAFGALPFVDATWSWERIGEVVEAHPPRRPSTGWNPSKVGKVSWFFDGTAWTGHYAVGETVYHKDD